MANLHVSCINVERPYLTTQMGRDQLNIDERIKDFFIIKREELIEICTALLKRYEERERTNPAAGIEVYFKVIARGKRAVEVLLDSCGKRETGEAMEMPKAPLPGK